MWWQARGEWGNPPPRGSRGDTYDTAAVDLFAKPPKLVREDMVINAAQSQQEGPSVSAGWPDLAETPTTVSVVIVEPELILCNPAVMWTENFRALNRC